MFKLISFLFGRRREPVQTGNLYRAIVAQSRKSDFYSRLGVPDTLDGRFDMIILHAFLVMRRLGRVGAEGAVLNQALFDLLFADMDSSLREIGVGDLSVGKKMKIMAQAFYGRVEAYEAGLKTAEASTLQTALARNLYGTVAPPEQGLEAMTAYVKRADAILTLQADNEIMAGNPAFSPPLW